jgi:Fanconi-associated nuclease 1
MLSRFLQQRQPSDLDSAREPPAKRRRVNDDESPSSRFGNRTILDSDAEDEDESQDAPTAAHQTDLESALPVVNVDADSIKEYEAFKASQTEDVPDGEESPKNRNWVKGKSSLYVDAFNLALDTVLDEESHLFDEAEMDVFRQWRHLDYEAQYL